MKKGFWHLEENRMLEHAMVLHDMGKKGINWQILEEAVPTRTKLQIEGHLTAIKLSKAYVNGQIYSILE